MAIDKPKKKKKPTYGVGSKTVYKRSGATKKTKISADGRKKTVTKTSKKGATKSRVTNISADYKTATYTKKKDGKVVKERKQKALTAKQADSIAASRGDYKSLAETRKKKAQKLSYDKPVKQKKRADSKKKRVDKRVDNKEWRKSDREVRKYKRGFKSSEAKKKRKKGKKVKSIKQIVIDIKDRCKGKTKGTKKCASTKKRNL